MPQIEVTFDIDANGILHVSAKDLGTGKEQKITISASSGLSKEEVEKMRKEAEEHAEEDRLQRESIEARNEGDNAVYRSEKLLRDNADKIPAQAKGLVESAVNAVKEALKGGEAAAIKAATEKLNEVWQSVSADLYKAASEQQGRGAGAGAGPGPGPGTATGSASTGSASAEKEGGDQGPIIDAEVVDENKR
jgi:molecular chaperone DnaK